MYYELYGTFMTICQVKSYFNFTLHFIISFSSTFNFLSSVFVITKIEIKWS